MGILNVTPDSFSDGGRYLTLDTAITRALTMVAEGADIIDIGGESSRPGAVAVTVTEELARVIPIINQLRRQSDVCISIDTTKAAVMKAAVAAGASMINDIAALQAENSLAVAADLDIPVCLMHKQGQPQSMQLAPHYPGGVVEEINLFFKERLACCLGAGIKRQNLILDPGFGFGKSSQHNLQIINQLVNFKQHNLPLLLGVSRKSTLGLIINKAVYERMAAGLTIAVLARLQGVEIIRTHDVKETKQTLLTMAALQAVQHGQSYECL